MIHTSRSTMLRGSHSAITLQQSQSITNIPQLVDEMHFNKWTEPRYGRVYLSRNLFPAISLLFSSSIISERMEWLTCWSLLLHRGRVHAQVWLLCQQMLSLLLNTTFTVIYLHNVICTSFSSKWHILFFIFKWLLKRKLSFLIIMNFDKNTKNYGRNNFV